MIYKGGNFMRIIVLGAGKIGKKITHYTAAEGHDVIVIDNNAKKIEEITNTYDVFGICGNGASYDILMEADVSKADIVICVTTFDELNLLAGSMAKQMGAHHVIVRVRNPDYLAQQEFMREKMGLSMIVNPELEAANVIRRNLLFPSAESIATFAGEKVELVQLSIQADSRLANKSLNDLAKVTKKDILICAIDRLGEIFIPNGETIILPGDQIYVTGSHVDLSIFCYDVGAIKQPVKNVMIIGGGKIAFYLAKQLKEVGIHVKIIEQDTRRAEDLARLLPYATVIEADGSDEDILLEEGIETTDAVLTLTGIDEENLILALMAKKLYNRKAIAKVTRMSNQGLARTVAVDSIIAPKSIVASQILQYVRAKTNHDEKTSIKTLYKMVNDEVEALEFIIPDHCEYSGKKIKDLPIKKHVLVATILRNGETIVAKGNTTIEKDDHIVVIAHNDKIKDLYDIFRR